MTTEQIIEVLDRWERSVDEILNRADEARLQGDRHRATSLYLRAYTFEQCRLDLKLACPELQLPDPGRILMAVPDA